MEYYSDQLSGSAVGSRGAGVRRHGFSLLEMLSVMTILVVVLAFGLPAVNSTLTAFRLSTGADMAVSHMVLARQSAIALNRTVEVRFYRFAVAGAPGEVESNPATGKYRAVQVFQYDDAGRAVALTKMKQLPEGIIFDSGSGTAANTLSSLLDTTIPQKAFSASLDSQVTLPGCGTAYTCKAYQILPAGNTTLATSQWFLTLHRDTDGDKLTAVPRNYATIQLDPTSGAVRQYRP